MGQTRSNTHTHTHTRNARAKRMAPFSEPVFSFYVPLRKGDLRSSRTQSAMEYLMTYGWAILIIAIVLGVLYYLGIFNSSTLAPRAQPGSCQVFRPNGAGTSFDIGLEGTCNDELPEYVTEFNGQSSYVNIGSTASLNLQGAITIVAWVNPYSYTNYGSIFQKYSGSVGDGYALRLYGTTGEPDLTIYNSGGSSIAVIAPTPLPLNQWSMVTATFVPGSSLNMYINGVGVQTSPTTFTNIYSNTYPAVIGWNQPVSSGFFAGLISNVQVYNASLSQAEITALYDEGIGGAPVKPQNVTGWWPLNGNAQDYSGDLNNGVANSVTYTSSWTSGYTAP